MTAPIIRVLLVDDDPLVRSALTLMLGGRDDITLVGEAANGQAGVVAARRSRPDVVLMDIRMPVLNGLEATRLLHAETDPPRVIVLTTFDADADVLNAIAAGADGFLLKDTEPAHIVEAIQRVAAGEPMLSPTATATLIRQVRQAGSPDRVGEAERRLESLTEREREVAVAVGKGLSNADIASSLYLSVPTVKAHVSRLFDKLHATNRVQIAMCVHDAGWV
ncbi:Response regulator receiver [metagenome]|uniref:Response regulator receiver n=1 Tax=metagenome TaxID=256318 RepID=A0A2P2C318_9ZZZZ